MPLKVLLVDDHRIMRDGLKAILSRSEEFEVVAEADNGADAVRLCRELQPEIVILDVEMPQLSGIDAAGEITRHEPSTRIVMLSMHDDEDSVIQALRAGARAFVLKRASSSELVEALETVAAGGSFVSREVSAVLIGRIQRGGLEGSKSVPGLEMLTPRELQVLRLVAEGKTSKEIAVLLDLGLETVRSYRKAMMKKTGVNNIAGLTQLALSSGLTKMASAKPKPGGEPS
jgi:DNA-binding NarL/FixJ family response regulator